MLSRQFRPFMYCCLLLISGTTHAQAPVYSVAQADKGKEVYQAHCQICHGTTLMNGQFGTPLRGSFFQRKWRGKSLGELFAFTVESMPPDNKEGLPVEQYAAALAYVLSRNDVEAGSEDMPADAAALNPVLLPW